MVNKLLKNVNTKKFQELAPPIKHTKLSVLASKDKELINNEYQPLI
jgi:hypothetical protein